MPSRNGDIAVRREAALGVTVHKTTDTVIATRCIASGLPLLCSHRDFDPFVEHLRLRSTLCRPAAYKAA